MRLGTASDGVCVCSVWLCQVFALTKERDALKRAAAAAASPGGGGSADTAALRSQLHKKDELVSQVCHLFDAPPRSRITLCCRVYRACAYWYAVQLCGTQSTHWFRGLFTVPPDGHKHFGDVHLLRQHTGADTATSAGVGCCPAVRPLLLYACWCPCAHFKLHHLPPCCTPHMLLLFLLAADSSAHPGLQSLCQHS
jgi:hypothetical protein